MTDTATAPPRARLYTLKEVAELLHKTERTVYNYVDAGLIATVRSGRTPVVTAAEYDRIAVEGVDTRGTGKVLKGAANMKSGGSSRKPTANG